jgi:hypothetical protein
MRHEMHDALVASTVDDVSYDDMHESCLV